ncbi:MAG: hypothetical protein Q9227_007310 [Pyrenula ochraceoflavens]
MSSPTENLDKDPDSSPRPQAKVSSSESNRRAAKDNTMRDPEKPSANNHENNPNASDTGDREAYSLFTNREKYLITALISYAGFFSTASSFIYYPALHLLSDSLSVSLSRINLTVTSYMAVATIAPTLVGDAADRMLAGRRGVYAACLGVYFAANVGIACSRSFGALLGLRVLQSFGISGTALCPFGVILIRKKVLMASSGTFSIAYGVITDIASPAERGSFVSIFSFG